MDISTAKFRLFNKCPFLGSIVFNLQVDEDDKCPTMGTDGFKLFYNPKFWNSLNNKEKLGVLAHEILHIILKHPFRMKERNEIAVDPITGSAISLWNIAADFASNLLILDMLNNACLPKGSLIDRGFAGWSTEKIYEHLKKNIKSLSSQQLSKLIEDSKKNSDKSKWGKKSKEQEKAIDRLIEQAREVAKQRGNLPSSLKRIFDELEPKEDWRQILLEYLQPYCSDYDISRPDRRYLEEDFYLPDLKSEQKIDWVAVAIDTSGSIDTKMLNSFISEIKGICNAYDKVKIKLTFCDAAASTFIEMEEYDSSKIVPTGGGGTSFVPVFDMISKESNKPQALFYFTDLDGEFPSKKPDYDVVWISDNKQSVPFGKLLKHEII